MSGLLAEELAPFRRASDYSARRLAQFAGVAPSTVTRIENGQMQPTFDVARELLTLVGSPLVSEANTALDAIAVAKSVVEGVALPMTDGMREWATRWQRGGLIDGDGLLPDLAARNELLRRTARVARVSTRPGFRAIPHRSWQDVFSALRTAGLEYALSGSPAANMWVSSAPDAEAVVYVSDSTAAEEIIWNLASSPGEPSLYVLPFDGVSETPRQEIDGVPMVSLAQIVIDCFGLPGRQPVQAEAILNEWEWSGK